MDVFGVLAFSHCLCFNLLVFKIQQQEIACVSDKIILSEKISTNLFSKYIFFSLRINALGIWRGKRRFQIMRGKALSKSKSKH